MYFQRRSNLIFSSIWFQVNENEKKIVNKKCLEIWGTGSFCQNLALIRLTF